MKASSFAMFIQNRSVMKQLRGTGRTRILLYHRGIILNGEICDFNVLFDLIDLFVLMESVCVLQMPGGWVVEV